MTEFDAGVSDEKSPTSVRIEWVLGLLIASLLAVVAIPGVRVDEDPSQANSAVSSIEELLLLARDEAMQTGQNHLVFFEGDPRGGPIVDAKGMPVMALLIRDYDGDWLPSLSEHIASVPMAPNSVLEWGSQRATMPAEGDTADEIVGPWSFIQPNGHSRARWLRFEADGAPHSFASISKEAGAAGSGAGTVYLRSDARDYAVVVSPWGDIEVQVWVDGAASWRNVDLH